MKKIAGLAVVICLLAIGVFAQNKPDYSGQWTLDKAKSKLDERSRIEEMTMKITQSATTVEVETKTKRAPRPEGMQGDGNRGEGNRRGGPGGMRGGDGTILYTLGKETVKETENERGKIQTKSSANLEANGTMTVSTSRTINTPNGEMTMTTKETWQLADGGKTLNVKRESQGMRGMQTTEMVFTKN